MKKDSNILKGKILKISEIPEAQALTAAICGSLSGVKIGDSIGKRAETMAPQAILDATGGKGIRGYGKALQGDDFSFFKGLKPGDHTDDYQLTAGIATSLIIYDGFNLENMGFTLAADYLSRAVGWGRTTRVAAEDILKYFQTWGRQGRCPSVPAPPAPRGQGGGNGIAMKISPLALYYGLQKKTNGLLYDSKALEELMLRNTMELGRMTHPDARASIAGYAVGKTIYNLVSQGYKSKWSEFDRYNFLNKLIADIKNAEFAYNKSGTMDDPFSSRLEYIRDERLLGNLERLISEVGTECFAMKSVPFAIAVFLRHPSNFRKGVLEAVNAGGDADTTAAMAGSMIGANVGIFRIPDKLKFYRADFWEPIDLGLELCKTVFS